MGKQSRKDRKEDEDRERRAKTDEGMGVEDKRFASTLNYLARGIIIGGSLAVMIGWLLPEANMTRMLGLGLLCGCLAGVTMKNINDRKRGR